MKHSPLKQLDELYHVDEDGDWVRKMTIKPFAFDINELGLNVPGAVQTVVETIHQAPFPWTSLPDALAIGIGEISTISFGADLEMEIAQELAQYDANAEPQFCQPGHPLYEVIAQFVTEAYPLRQFTSILAFFIPLDTNQAN